MNSAKGTTPRALQIEGTNNGVGESFRVLYYGSAAAGSVPFMWESQPGTPKHALTESFLPPLTPPPSYHQCSQKYNSSMQLINHRSSKTSGFFRNFFLASSRKNNIATVPAPAFSRSSTWHSTPMSKTEVRRMMSVVKYGLEDGCGEQGHAGGGSPTSAPCLDGEFKRSYRINKMKKVIQWFVRHGKG